MINNSNYNRGYIGLIALMIVVAIMAFIMIKQYENLGLAQSKEESANGLINVSGTDSGSATPIERAQNAKNTLETRDRSMLNQ
mgnify:FL=1